MTCGLTARSGDSIYCPWNVDSMMGRKYMRPCTDVMVGKMFRYFIILLISTQLTGCYYLKAPFAMLKSTDNFHALVENPSVKYEEGARENALLISPYVNGVMKVVEAKQYGSFPEGVIIYLPKDLESFSSYCACKTPRAIVIGGRVFISPILLDEPESIQGRRRRSHTL
jgi:hypothetical protein